jgi:peptide/nickel transport system permease protein
MNRDFVIVLIRRISTSLIVLFLMITFVFILLRISPGDPAQKFISPELSPELAKNIRESFNLNSSILTQYKSFLVNLARGDLGISYNHREPVLTVIMQYLPFTIFFSLISFILQLAVGGALALLALKYLNRSLDTLLVKLNLVFYAVPSFVVGVFLILIFSEVLNLLPSSGLRSFDFDRFSIPQKIMDYAVHLILPIITLSLSGIAIFFRYLRDSLEETMNKPFVLNLRANGYNEKTIMLKHVVPNAISPLAAAAGVELGVLLGGALITEVIFGLPGMGRLAVKAILLRDYPLIIGCTLIAGVLVILSNLLSDIVKAKIDKRTLKEILN